MKVSKEIFKRILRKNGYPNVFLSEKYDTWYDEYVEGSNPDFNLDTWKGRRPGVIDMWKMVLADLKDDEQKLMISAIQKAIDL